MSAHMKNINNDTNNTNNQDRQDPSGGDIEHVAPEDQATLSSSTHSTTGSSSSRPMSSADHVRALAHDQEDESMVHANEGLILSSDRVSAAGDRPIRPIPFGPTTIPNWACPIWALQLGPSHLGPAFGSIPFRPVLFGPILFGPMVVSNFIFSIF